MKQIIVQFTKLRQHKGYTYHDIEQGTGIPAARMKELESGRSSITIDELEKLLAFYRMTYRQVMRFKRRRSAYIALAAALASVALLAVLWATVFDGPQRAGFDVADAPGGDGSPAAAEEADGAAGTASGEEDGVAAAETVGAAADGAPSAAAPAGESGRTADEDAGSARAADEPAADGGQAPADAVFASPGAQDPDVERVLFRFWGHIPYGAARLPQAGERDGVRVIDVVPVERLQRTDRLPGWMQDRSPEQFILNAGTAEVWTPTTVETYRSLQEEGFQTIGLGTLPDVYEPLILEINGRKIGFLSLAGIIRNAEEIALKSRVGLARAYREDEVTAAVQNAKEQVDFLFVLIDWGKQYDLAPNVSQQVIAAAIVRAGGDAVIGNRPFQAQEFTAIDGRPVFYSLGHSVSDKAPAPSYNLIVEAEFSTQLDRLTVVVGKLTDEELRFALTPEERMEAQAAYSDMARSIDMLEVAW
jgi:transcriptional regulator with XRE-family HTH domain